MSTSCVAGDVDVRNSGAGKAPRGAASVLRAIKRKKNSGRTLIHNIMTKINAAPLASHPKIVNRVHGLNK